MTSQDTDFQAKIEVLSSPLSLMKRTWKIAFRINVNKIVTTKQIDYECTRKLITSLFKCHLLEHKYVVAIDVFVCVFSDLKTLKKR